MLRFHFFTAKQGTWVHKDDRSPLILQLTKRRKSEKSDQSKLSDIKKDKEHVEEDIADLKDIKPEINGDISVKSKHVAKKAKLIKNPIIGKLSKCNLYRVNVG